MNPQREDRDQLVTMPPPDNELAPVASNGSSAAILSVIERAASDPSVDVEKMERLLKMQREIMAESAKAEFVNALANLQGTCPQIKRKSKGGHGNYAKYEDMMKIVRPLMMENGFTETFDTSTAERLVKVVCTLFHRAGHSTISTFEAPIDKSGSKNDIQAVASTISYGKRYSLGQALGLVFTDEDDDGAAISAASEQAADLAPRPKPFDRAKALEHLGTIMQHHKVSGSELLMALVRLKAPGITRETEMEEIPDDVLKGVIQTTGWAKIINMLGEIQHEQDQEGGAE